MLQNMLASRNSIDRRILQGTDEDDIAAYFIPEEDLERCALAEENSDEDEDKTRKVSSKKEKNQKQSKKKREKWDFFLEISLSIFTLLP